MSNDPAIEAAYATVLHASGAKVADCIAAYRVALTLEKAAPTCLINLAQCLFLVGGDDEAIRRPDEAQRLDLDGVMQLEAEFYRLAHTSTPATQTLRSIAALVRDGARTQWNVEPNIEFVGRPHPDRADVLRTVSEVMSGRRPAEDLDELIASEG